MPTEELKRMMSRGRLSPDQVARDQEIRRKAQEEFPPVVRVSMTPGEMSQSLKRAIQASGKSVYQIAKEAGVSQIVISRFLSGERDLRLATADKLADVLRLRLVAEMGG